MKKNIELGEENKILRTKSEEVKNFKDTNLKQLVKDLIETLEKTKTGVGLAAPQIGKHLSVFVILKNIANQIANNHQVFINPKILKKSDQEITIEEGCLSLPASWGLIRRPEKIKIEAFDENGKKFKIKAEGFLAQIFQHETDHLNGVLFIDKALQLWKMSPKQK